MSLPNHKNCCGCSACRSICPTSAITMKPDNEGFLQPVIDSAKCVHCGKCEKVCPVLHHGKPRKPLAVYAAKAKDDELRAGSASGGIFTLLALDVLKRGGVVFGAGFDHSDWRVIHKAAHNEEELDDLRGSKYVQSDVGDTYKEAKQLLDAGQEVLYSGCPCQIAALLNFLGKPYPNLTTVDLICHGVPSPLAWAKYIEAREQLAKSKIRRTFFRRYCAWRKYALSFEFSNDKAYFNNIDDDPFLASYLRGWMNRSSCFHCQFRYLRSGADITLGDYWKAVLKETPFGKDDIGISIASCNTLSAKRSLTSCEDLVTSYSIDFKSVCKINESLVRDPKRPRLRHSFIAELKTSNYLSCFANFLTKYDHSTIHHALWWIKRLIINHEVNKF